MMERLSEGQDLPEACTGFPDDVDGISHRHVTFATCKTQQRSVDATTRKVFAHTAVPTINAGLKVSCRET